MCHNTVFTPFTEMTDKNIFSSKISPKNISSQFVVSEVEIVQICVLSAKCLHKCLICVTNVKSCPVHDSMVLLLVSVSGSPWWLIPA